MVEERKIGMRFKENIDAPKAFKEEYRDGIFSLIESREKELEKVRKEYAKDIFKSPEKYRGDLKEMLGWPLTQKREGGTSYTQEKLADEDGFEIIRMHFEIFEGVKLTGLLFKITDGERRPFVIAQHGGLGSPEHVAGINADSTENYHEMIDRILKYGANVFAPQLLIWDEKKYDVPYVRHEIDAKLKRVGSSISAVEIYGIQRIIDYFETQDYVGNIGMIGLSYGGFYSLITGRYIPGWTGLGSILPQNSTMRRLRRSFIRGGSVLRSATRTSFLRLNWQKKRQSGLKICAARLAAIGLTSLYLTAPMSFIRTINRLSGW